MGYQVRDCFHPRDLAAMIWKQMNAPTHRAQRTQNLGGGADSAISLAQLSDWCADRFGKHAIGRDPEPRPFDVPWMVLDSNLAHQQWAWSPARKLEEILGEIADHAEKNPHWLKVSAAL